MSLMLIVENNLKDVSDDIKYKLVKDICAHNTRVIKNAILTYKDHGTYETLLKVHQDLFDGGLLRDEDC